MSSTELSFREKRLKELEDRRAKHQGDHGPSYRLTIPDHIHAYLKANDLEARWLNDDERGRIYDKTNRDTWDFLMNDEVATDNRNAIPGNERIARRVGTKEDGSALFTYLCVKPKKWFDEDARKRARPNEEMMASIRNRPIKTSQESDLSDDEEHAYIPREVKLRAKGLRRSRNEDIED